MRENVKFWLMASVLGMSFIVFTQSHAESDYSYLKGLSGDMVSYCANEPEICEAVIELFNEKVDSVNANNNFNASVVRYSTGDLVKNITEDFKPFAEKAKSECAKFSAVKADEEKCKEQVYDSKVDVAFYGTDDPYKSALEDDVFSSYDYPKDANVHAWAADLSRSSDDRLGGLYLGVLGLGVNTELLAKQGLDMPKCWKDLQHPNYKGQIVMANWNTSGTAYKFAATMMRAFRGGESEGWSVVRGIHKNIAEYTKSGSKGGKMAAAGETLIGIGFGHDIVNLKQKGNPIDLVVPCEGTLFEIGPVGILRGAKNRVAAEAFVKFLYEPETQNMLATIGSLQFPSNKSSKIPAGAESLVDAKLLYAGKKYTLKSVKEKIIAQWTKDVFPLPR